MEEPERMPMAKNSKTELFVIRECGFGGPASMFCPVHPNAKIVRTATITEKDSMSEAVLRR
jgi:hypothetical protein